MVFTAVLVLGACTVLSEGSEKLVTSLMNVAPDKALTVGRFGRCKKVSRSAKRRGRGSSGTYSFCMAGTNIFGTPLRLMLNLMTRQSTLALFSFSGINTMRHWPVAFNINYEFSAN